MAEWVYQKRERGAISEERRNEIKKNRVSEESHELQGSFSQTSKTIPRSSLFDNSVAQETETVNTNPKYDFGDMDNLGVNIIEACERPTKENLANVLAKYRWKVSEENLNELNDIITVVRNMPVTMFEAKPQRVVGFDEIKSVILPSSASEELKNALSERNIPYEVYEEGNNQQRKDILNSHDEVKFSKKSKIYSYEYMMKQGDVEVHNPKEYNLKTVDTEKIKKRSADENKKYDRLVRDEVKLIGHNNIKRYNDFMGRSELGDDCLIHHRLGKVRINDNSFIHGINRVDEKSNYYIETSLPSYFENSVIVNELYPDNSSERAEYVLIGLYSDEEKTELVKMIVSEKNSQKEVNRLEILHSIKKRKQAVRNLTPSGTIRSGKPAFKMKISDFIDYVNEVYPDLLSVDINENHYGKERPVFGDTPKGLKKSAKDSTGRELSEGQQEYFRESKVRDENGNLLVMYHGTPNAGFTVFDKKKITSSNLYGRGFYFTSDSGNANLYGQKYEVYLNIVKPLDNVNATHDITKEQLRKFIQAVAEDEDYGIENYGYGATVDSVLKGIFSKEKTDFEMIQDISLTCIGDTVSALKLFNEVNGTNYDGIIAPDQTIVFESNQIKNADNLNPTSNQDIRYSLKNIKYLCFLRSVGRW